jgi:hypothetical protein
MVLFSESEAFRKGKEEYKRELKRVENEKKVKERINNRFIASDL